MVTWSRVALTARQNHNVQCLSFLLAGLISPIFLFSNSWFLELYLSLNQTEMQIVPPPLICSHLFLELAFLRSAIMPRLDLKPCCHLQTSHPSFSSYWVFHAEWPFPPCQSNLSSESRAASCRNKEVRRQLLRKRVFILHLDPKRNKPPVWFQQAHVYRLHLKEQWEHTKP